MSGGIEGDIEWTRQPRDWASQLASVAGVDGDTVDLVDAVDAEVVDVQPDAASAIASPPATGEQLDALVARVDAVHDIVVLIGTTIEALGRRQIELAEALGELRDRPAPVAAREVGDVTLLEGIGDGMDRLAVAHEALVTAIEKLDLRLDGAERRLEDLVTGSLDEKRAAITRRLAEAQVQLTDSHAGLSQSVYTMQHELAEVRAAVTAISRKLLS